MRIMKMLELVYCCVWTAGLLKQFGGVEIVEAPTNVTVIVNSSAVFRCATRRTDYVVWLINGTSLYYLQSSFRENIDTTQHTEGENELYQLRIYSSWIWYDGIVVQCLAGDNDEQGESEVTADAVLRVQGTLSSVSRLRGTIKWFQHERSLNISWTAPFSLNITNTDPDIWYTVHILNVTEETAVLVPPRCVNITDTYCIFTPYYSSPCHKYSYTVIPQNGAGHGKQKSFIAALYEDLNRFPSYSISLETHSDGHYSLAILLAENVSEALCMYNIFMESKVDECSSMKYSFEEKSPTNTTIKLAVHPDVDCFYSITVQLQNAISQSNSTKTLDTRVLLVRTEQTNGSFYIHCSYANTTPYSGCYVIVIGTNNDYYSTDTVTSQGTKTFSDLQAGRYAVLVHGKEGENQFTLNPAHTFYTVLDIGSSLEPTVPATSVQRSSFIKGLVSGVTVGVLITIILSTIVLLTARCRKSNSKKGKAVLGTPSITTETNTAYSTTPMTLSVRNNAYQDQGDVVYDVID